MGGLRLALTTLTVLPLPVGRVDRRAAGVAMSLAPLVGLLLGLVLAGAGLALRAAGSAPLLAGAVVVGLGVALTRGMHVDGLADTADGLGSYRDAEGALDIMKKPDIGPFGVAAIVVVLLVQAAAAASVLSRPWPAALAGIVTVAGAGRLAVAVACRRGMPAARPDGMGALVAGTVPVPVLVAWTAVVAALATFAVPGRPWLGALSVVLAVGAAFWLTSHARRRLGGLTGDVIGAAVEVATVVTAVGLAQGGSPY